MLASVMASKAEPSVGVTTNITNSESNPTMPLFSEYASDHEQIVNGTATVRQLTESQLKQLQEECDHLLEEMSAANDGNSTDGVICLPVQLAEDMLKILDQKSGSDIAIAPGTGTAKLLGERGKLQPDNEAKSALRAARDAVEDFSKTLLFSAPDSDSIEGTMVVDNGRVNAVMYGDHNVTMIMPCRNSPDPRCHVALTITSKQNTTAEAAQGQTTEKAASGTVDSRHLAAATGTLVHTIDFMFTPDAAAQAGGTTAALRQAALIRMESANTVYQNSGLNIRYVLGKVTVAERGITGAQDALNYGSQKKQRSDADYLAVIATATEMQNSNGRAYQDCVKLVADKIHSQMYKCLVLAARLFTAGHITYAHELGHLQGGGHEQSQPEGTANFYGRAKVADDYEYATALTSYESDVRLPVFSQLHKLYRGMVVGEPGRQNGVVIAFRAKQINQHLRNLPVDPDPIPVCAPYIAAKNSEQMTLKAIPGDVKYNVISFFPKPDFLANNNRVTGFTLNFMTNNGLKPIKFAAFSTIDGAQQRAQADIVFDLKPFNIEFVNKKTANVEYFKLVSNKPVMHKFTINLAGNDEFIGQVKFANLVKVTGFDEIICQTGYAYKSQTATTPPSAPVTFTAAPSRATKNPTAAPPTKSPIAPSTQYPTVQTTKAPTKAPVARATKAPTLSTWDKNNAALVQQVKSRFSPLPSNRPLQRLAESLRGTKDYLEQNAVVLDIVATILRQQRGLIASQRFTGFTESVGLNSYLNILDTLITMDADKKDKFLAAVDTMKWNNRRQAAPENFIKTKKALSLALDACLDVGATKFIGEQITMYFNTRSPTAKEDYRADILWKISKTLADADIVANIPTSRPTAKKPRG